MSKSTLVDTTRSIGYGSCVAVCKEANGLPPGDSLLDFQLLADTLNVVQTAVEPRDSRTMDATINP